MSSVLSSFFSKDPRAAFQYELPDHSQYVHYGVSFGPSHKKADPTVKATAIWSSSANPTLRTQAQKLKTIRHPNVLTFYDSLENSGNFYLITEPCVPVELYFEQNELTASQKELFVSWVNRGSCLQSTLKFLHADAKLTQGNISESIFITDAGDWKLSGFHCTEEFRSSKKDFNSLAEVLWQIFNDFRASSGANKSIERLPRRMHGLFKKLDSKGKTFAAADLLAESRSAGGFLKNKFVDTLLFLDEFQLKDSGEKQAFFMSLKDNLSLYPNNIAKYKILPKLMNAYEYGDAGSHILLPMFRLGKLLDDEEYQQRIVPCLVKLFSSPDRTTRVKLLEHIDEFAPHIKSQVLNDKIYSNLVTGFLDTNPAVRESTVKAMVVFAEKLNYNNLNMDLMKYLARLQGSDDQPGIRTNTTICLGKIGCYLDPSHRQRILINAFTRALKDPFPPARMAGVLALSATQQYYSLVEVATKILPALSPLSVDPDKQVRDQGFRSLRGFLENLQRASDDPSIIPELEAQVKSGAGKASYLSSDKLPAWAGWALTSISGKFYKSTPSTAASPVSGAGAASDAKRPSTTPSAAPSSTPSTTTPSPAVSSPPSPAPTPPPTRRPPTMGSKLSTARKPASTAAATAPTREPSPPPPREPSPAPSDKSDKSDYDWEW